MCTLCRPLAGAVLTLLDRWEVGTEAGQDKAAQKSEALEADCSTAVQTASSRC